MRTVMYGYRYRSNTDMGVGVAQIWRGTLIGNLLCHNWLNVYKHIM